MLMGGGIGRARAVEATEDDAKRWETSTTLQNSQEAYNGEMNANARYTAFAKQADEEGYGPVASLFLAAARAEEVHAKALAEVVKKLGAEPQADLKVPAVKTTRENLEAALKGENYERDAMYPAFVKRAGADQEAGAARIFRYAKTAETGHAKLYDEALKTLDTLKKAEPAVYYVCTVCGYTVTKAEFTFNKCPSCGQPKEKYVEVK
jgi:rubrerythrin